MIKVYYGDELYHHGVLGMKWGRRQGPPYPLTPSQHSASEKKDGWRKSLSDKRAAGRTSRAEAARTYNQRYDESIRRANAADEKWADVKSQYKALGKNTFQRIKAVRDAEKGKGTDAAKKYLADFDEAERMSNDADSHWNETKDYYKKSGRNPIERVTNTATNGKGLGNVLKEKYNSLSDKQKTAIKIGAAAVATGLALYATYKISERNAGKLHEQFKFNADKGENFINQFFRSDARENSAASIINSYDDGYTKTSVSLGNPYYRYAADARNSLRNNIYNRITGKYDDDIGTTLSVQGYRTEENNHSLRYPKITTERRNDFFQNIGNRSYVEDRKYKRSLKNKRK